MDFPILFFILYTSIWHYYTQKVQSVETHCIAPVICKTVTAKKKPQAIEGLPQKRC